jgi:hypothetical protein
MLRLALLALVAAAGPAGPVIAAAGPGFAPAGPAGPVIAAAGPAGLGMVAAGPAGLGIAAAGPAALGLLRLGHGLSGNYGRLWRGLRGAGGCGAGWLALLPFCPAFFAALPACPSRLLAAPSLPASASHSAACSRASGADAQFFFSGFTAGIAKGRPLRRGAGAAALSVFSAWGFGVLFSFSLAILVLIPLTIVNHTISNTHL